MMEFGKEGAVFFATDGRQLAYVKDPGEKYANPKHAMIEAKVINQISKKNILDQSKEIDISISDEGSPRVRFVQDSLVIISNFMELWLSYCFTSL